MAIAIIWVNKPAAAPTQNQNATGQPTIAQINMRPVTAADHILGNPNAPIKIVEFSDPSCPYCKLFNPTMEQIMSDYGPGGKVAWIYRHFPLDKPDQNGNILHKNAGHEAQAMECAASLGGNDKFWAFEKNWYNTIPENGAVDSTSTDQAMLLAVAKNSGLDQSAFSDCLSSGQFKNKVEADYTDGLNAGVSGTPFSVLITPSGTKIPLVGAQSYQTIKSAIDALLSQN